MSGDSVCAASWRLHPHGPPSWALVKALFRLPDYCVLIRSIYVTLAILPMPRSGANCLGSLPHGVKVVISPPHPTHCATWLVFWSYGIGYCDHFRIGDGLWSRVGVINSRLYLLITPGTGWRECSEKWLSKLPVSVAYSHIRSVSREGAGGVLCVRLFQLLYGPRTPEDSDQPVTWVVFLHSCLSPFCEKLSDMLRSFVENSQGKY